MKKPITLKLAAIFMLILALLVGGFSAVQQFGLLRGLAGVGRPGTLVTGGEMPRNFQGRTPGEMPTFEEGGGEVFINPGDGSQPELEVVPGSGTGPGFRQFGSGGGTRIRSVGGLSFLAQFAWLQNWLGIGLGVLGLLAAFLVWKPARWGIILSVIVGLLIILVSIPSMLSLPVLFTFPTLALWSVVPAIVQIVLAVTVLVMVLLPASRRAVHPAVVIADGDEEEEPERVVL